MAKKEKYGYDNPFDRAVSPYVPGTGKEEYGENEKGFFGMTSGRWIPKEDVKEYFPDLKPSCTWPGEVEAYGKEEEDERY